MNRTPSVLAQGAFSATNRLQKLASHASFPLRQFAQAANKLVIPISRRLGSGHYVSAHLYGHELLMPAEHPLAATLAVFPQYNRPLGLAAQAIVECRKDQDDPPLVVVDVGANIGETVAIIEHRCPGVGRYLCIEADQEIAELCTLNHKANDRVQVKQCFIGENEGAAVWLQDDGRANPSTKLADAVGTHGSGRLVRLDNAAKPFGEQYGTIDLLKIDTEGYDFSVLRSAASILNNFRPAVYFEWFPALLSELGEQIWDGFEYLETIGYQSFVFFTSRGDYYCTVDRPDRRLIQDMAMITAPNSIAYFDIFSCTDRAICNRLSNCAHFCFDWASNIADRSAPEGIA
jgi:FkbM family methyltransferase